jgi:hypothetical protein
MHELPSTAIAACAANKCDCRCEMGAASSYEHMPRRRVRIPNLHKRNGPVAPCGCSSHTQRERLRHLVIFVSLHLASRWVYSPRGATTAML